MSGFVLDTTVLIEYAQGVEPTTARVLELVEGKVELFICAVQLAEYYAGEMPGTNPAMDAFIARLTFMPLTRPVALLAANYRYELALQDRRLRTPDALIAALARTTSATLVTNNVRDFPIPNITIERLGGTP